MAETGSGEFSGGPSDDSGPSRTGTVPVWDLPVRLFHWVLAVLVVAGWTTGKLGRLDLHMRIGEVILALVIFRLVWGFVGSPTARFGGFLARPRTVLAHARELWGQVRGRPAQKTGGAHLGHTALGGWMVLALLLVLASQTGSGLFSSDEIVTDAPLNHLVGSGTAHWLEWVHWIGSWLIPILVAIHIGAALFYLVRARENLIAPMITGRKRIAADASTASLRFASPWLALTVLIASVAIVWAIISL